MPLTIEKEYLNTKDLIVEAIKSIKSKEENNVLKHLMSIVQNLNNILFSNIPSKLKKEVGKSITLFLEIDKLIKDKGISRRLIKPLKKEYIRLDNQLETYNKFIIKKQKNKKIVKIYI